MRPRTVRRAGDGKNGVPIATRVVNRGRLTEQQQINIILAVIRDLHGSLQRRDHRPGPAKVEKLHFDCGALLRRGSLTGTTGREHEARRKSTQPGASLLRRSSGMMPIFAPGGPCVMPGIR